MALTLLHPSMTTPAFNDQQVPIGTVQILTSLTMPKGWLLCNGDSYSKVNYPDLFAVIGNTFGGTDPNFNVPTISSIGGTGRLRYAIKALRYDP